MSTKKQRKDSWFSKRDCAAAFGVSIQHFNTGQYARYVEALNDEHIRAQGKGHATLIYLPALFELVVQARINTAIEVSGGDVDMMGPSSPALEKYREARAARETLKLEHERGELVNRDAVRNTWRAIGQALHRAIERVRREHGKPPAAIIERTLSQCEKAIKAATNRQDEAKRGDA